MWGYTPVRITGVLVIIIIIIINFNLTFHISITPSLILTLNNETHCERSVRSYCFCTVLRWNWLLSEAYDAAGVFGCVCLSLWMWSIFVSKISQKLIFGFLQNLWQTDILYTLPCKRLTFGADHIQDLHNSCSLISIMLYIIYDYWWGDVVAANHVSLCGHVMNASPPTALDNNINNGIIRHWWQLH